MCLDLWICVHGYAGYDCPFQPSLDGAEGGGAHDGRGRADRHGQQVAGNDDKEVEPEAGIVDDNDGDG